MAVDVVSEIIINAPPERVAAYAGDPSNAPEWYINIESVEWQTDPPVAVGSRMNFVAHFLGRRLAYTYEVLELVPGRSLVMRTTQGPFPMETTYTWQPHDAAATRMTLRNRGEPTGFTRIATPVLAAAMRRANAKDLAALRRHLETGEPS
ncbi:SRPBCC family protein [Actinoplanes sp. NPDC049548]|uniref:SRPBCC family protein n=1 Tax=Actinoplanes sp. NPDC049548 TaxID=3155152 RepID=UPI0034232195